MKDFQFVTLFLFALQAASYPFSNPSPNAIQSSDVHESEPNIMARFIRDNQKGNVEQSRMMNALCEKHLEQIRNVTGLQHNNNAALSKRGNWHEEDGKLSVCHGDVKHALSQTGMFRSKEDNKPVNGARDELHLPSALQAKQGDKSTPMTSVPGLLKRFVCTEENRRIGRSQEEMTFYSDLFSQAVSVEKYEMAKKFARSLDEQQKHNDCMGCNLKKRFICVEENKRIERGENEMHFYSDLFSQAVQAQKDKFSNQSLL